MKNISKPTGVRAILLLGLWLGCSAYPVHAHPDELSSLNIEDLAGIDLVYGASRYLQHVLEAPASITIITAEDIERFGYETVAEALGGIPGFYTTYDRHFQYVGSRGFSPPGDFNRRILLTINGNRANENVFGGAGMGSYSLINIEAVDRIEVIRGPGSSIYGNGAFYGIVNIITKTAQNHPGLRVTAQAGSYETGAAGVQWGRVTDSGLDLLLTANVYRSGGQSLYFPEYDTPGTNYGVASGADADERFDMHARLNYGELSLEGALVRRDKSLPAAPFFTVFNDSRTHSVNTQGFLSGNVVRNPTDDPQFSIRASYNNHVYTGEWIYPTAGDSTFMETNDLSGEWFGAEVQTLYTPPGPHNLTVGMEVRRNIRGFVRHWDDTKIGDDGQKGTEAGVYLQDAVQVHPLVLVHAGLRHDYFSDAEPHLSPRAGVNVRLSDYLSGAFVAGHAFRSPNALEIITSNSQAQRPRLQVESINTYEAMLSYGDERGAMARLSLYTYELDNLIVSRADSLSTLFFTNFGGVSTKGMEVSGTIPLSRSLTTEVGYTFQHARTRSTDEEIPNSPEHLAFLRLKTRLQQHAWLGTEVRYVGERYSAGMVPVNAVALVNATLSGTLDEQWRWGVSVKNLLDTDYEHPASGEHLQNSIPQNGRNVMVSVGCRF